MKLLIDEAVIDQALEALEYNDHLRGLAINALRQAKEQPTPPPECKTEAEKTAFGFGWWKAMESQREQAQKQEPVACNECKEWEKVCNQHLRHIKKLKAKREWQGLTDDEIALISAECSLRTPSDIYFARAIEAKLKERNR